MMVLCPVPTKLQTLTSYEEQLVTNLFQAMQAYMEAQYGTIRLKGYVIPLPYNFQKLLDIYHVLSNARYSVSLLNYSSFTHQLSRFIIFIDHY